MHKHPHPDSSARLQVGLNCQDSGSQRNPKPVQAQGRCSDTHRTDQLQASRDPEAQTRGLRPGLSILSTGFPVSMALRPASPQAESNCAPPPPKCPWPQEWKVPSHHRPESHDSTGWAGSALPGHRDRVGRWNCRSPRCST
jgi:hypothetical protein